MQQVYLPHQRQISGVASRATQHTVLRAMATDSAVFPTPTPWLWSILVVRSAIPPCERTVYIIVLKRQFGDLGGQNVTSTEGAVGAAPPFDPKTLAALA